MPYDHGDSDSDGESICTTTTLVGSDAGPTSPLRLQRAGWMVTAAPAAAPSQPGRAGGGSRGGASTSDASQRRADAGASSRGPSQRRRHSHAAALDNSDAVSLASQTSTLLNVPRPLARTRTSAVPPSHVQDPHRSVSGIPQPRRQMTGPTDYGAQVDDDSIPVMLRRASIDSTATDLLQRSAAAANENHSLVVPWWNAMLPTPMMTRARPPDRHRIASADGSRAASSSTNSSFANNSDRWGGARNGNRLSSYRAAPIDNSSVSNESAPYTPRPASEYGRGPTPRPAAEIGRDTQELGSYTTRAASELERPNLHHSTRPRGVATSPRRQDPHVTSRAADHQRPLFAPRRQASHEDMQDTIQNHRRTSDPMQGRPSSHHLQSNLDGSLANRSATAASGIRFDFSSAVAAQQQRSHSMPLSDEAGLLAPPALPATWPLYTKCYCEENAYILAAYLDRECRRRNRWGALIDAWQWSVDIVVVSNNARTVALWRQRASDMPETDHIVIWDYHVFVMVTCRPRSTPPGATMLLRRASRDERKSISQAWVYDLDTRLPVPVSLHEYLRATFKSEQRSTVAEQFQPRFRVVCAQDFLAHFASDRSHMRVPQGSGGTATDQDGEARYSSAPPLWAAIRGPKADTVHNLMDAYVEMRHGNQSAIQVGTVVSQAATGGHYGVVISLEELAQVTSLRRPAWLRSRKVPSPQQSGPSSGTAQELLQGAQGDDEPQHLDARIAKLLADNGHGKAYSTYGNRVRERLSYATPQSSSATASSSSNGPEHSRSWDFLDSNMGGVHEDDQEEQMEELDDNVDGGDEDNSPGILIGGVRRIYGVRPPPPPPDADPVQQRRSINFSGRGKRVSDPLFPAYLHASLENRAERERAVTAAASAAAAAGSAMAT